MISKYSHEDLYGRLYNAKFESALKYIDKRVSSEDKDLIEALAKCFGNTGFMFGSMGEIVGAAVRSLIGEEKE